MPLLLLLTLTLRISPVTWQVPAGAPRTVALQSAKGVLRGLPPEVQAELMELRLKARHRPSNRGR